MSRSQENADARQRLRDTDIDSYLTHHRDTIIFSTINESRRSAEADFQSIHGRFVIQYPSFIVFV
jgi:hypothetical protein